MTISADGTGRWLLEVEDAGEPASFPSEAAALEAAAGVCAAEGLSGWVLVQHEDGDWDVVTFGPAVQH